MDLNVLKQFHHRHCYLFHNASGGNCIKSLFHGHWWMRDVVSLNNRRSKECLKCSEVLSHPLSCGSYLSGWTMFKCLKDLKEACYGFFPSPLLPPFSLSLSLLLVVPTLWETMSMGFTVAWARLGKKVCFIFVSFSFCVLLCVVFLDITEHIAIVMLPFDYKEGVNCVVYCVIQCGGCWWWHMSCSFILCLGKAMAKSFKVVFVLTHQLLLSSEVGAHFFPPCLQQQIPSHIQRAHETQTTSLNLQLKHK